MEGLMREWFSGILLKLLSTPYFAPLSATMPTYFCAKGKLFPVRGYDSLSFPASSRTSSVGMCEGKWEEI